MRRRRLELRVAAVIAVVAIVAGRADEAGARVPPAAGLRAVRCVLNLNVIPRGYWTFFGRTGQVCRRSRRWAPH